ncbi:MAG: hypothetical protein PHF46_04040 [Candidatus Gracilibacteria bacterium]|nr:hypothetical protein [Candidatus Gracilibacteria bacterium]MDD4529960.1 hypothetical protein [Candidatus Gracilibacteria bacterium]
MAEIIDDQNYQVVSIKEAFELAQSGNFNRRVLTILEESLSSTEGGMFEEIGKTRKDIFYILALSGEENEYSGALVLLQDGLYKIENSEIDSKERYYCVYKIKNLLLKIEKLNLIEDFLKLAILEGILDPELNSLKPLLNYMQSVLWDSKNKKNFKGKQSEGIQRLKEKRRLNEGKILEVNSQCRNLIPDNIEVGQYKVLVLNYKDGTNGIVIVSYKDCINSKYEQIRHFIAIQIWEDWYETMLEQSGIYGKGLDNFLEMRKDGKKGAEMKCFISAEGKKTIEFAGGSQDFGIVNYDVLYDLLKKNWKDFDKYDVFREDKFERITFVEKNIGKDDKIISFAKEAINLAKRGEFSEKTMGILFGLISGNKDGNLFEKIGMTKKDILYILLLANKENKYSKLFDSLKTNFNKVNDIDLNFKERLNFLNKILKIFEDIGKLNINQEFLEIMVEEKIFDPKINSLDLLDKYLDSISQDIETQKNLEEEQKKIEAQKLEEKRLLDNLKIGKINDQCRNLIPEVFKKGQYKVLLFEYCDGTEGITIVNYDDCRDGNRGSRHMEAIHFWFNQYREKLNEASINSKNINFLEIKEVGGAELSCNLDGELKKIEIFGESGDYGQADYNILFKLLRENWKDFDKYKLLKQNEEEIIFLKKGD